MAGDLPIVSKVYDVLLWTLPHLARLPRTHRFLLGDRVATALLGLQESLVRAGTGRERLERLTEASVSLDVLRLEVCLLKDLRLLSLNRYEHLARELNEVGRMLGGWLKASASAT